MVERAWYPDDKSDGQAVQHNLCLDGVSRAAVFLSVHLHVYSKQLCPDI